MGARGLRAGLRAPDLDQHDRLAALGGELGHRDEFRDVFEAFDETRDDARFRIVDEVAREVGEVEIGFVAGRDDVAQADARVHRAQQERAESRRAALTHERDVSGQTAERARGRGRPDIVPHVREPQAIRSGDAQARLLRERAHFLLQLEPRVRPALGESRGNDDRGTGLLPMAFLQHVEHLVERHHDADEIRRFRKIADAAVRAHAADLLVIRIHRVDAYAVLGFQHRVQQAPAVTSALRRCPDHRDRARVEHLVDRAHLVFGPELHLQPFFFERA